MKKTKNTSNDCNNLFNDIWSLKESLRDPELSLLDVILEYIELHNLDPDEVGEMIASNKNFVKILENELIQSHVFKTDKKQKSFDEWE